MDNHTSILKFEWEGDAKGADSAMLIVTVNDTPYPPFNYNVGCELEIPIAANVAEIKVEYQHAPNKRKSKAIQHTFDLESGKNYQCRLSGKIKDFSGLGLQLCPENEDIEGASVCHTDGAIAFISFLFPIYGIIKAISCKYNKAASLLGALIGFVFSMSFSFLAEDGDKIGFGLGHSALFEYDPFSITDITINLLIGGVSTLRGLLVLFMENILP